MRTTNHAPEDRPVVPRWLLAICAVMTSLVHFATPVAAQLVASTPAQGERVPTVTINRGELSTGADSLFNFKLNLWSYDSPRYTKPFYYGVARHGVCLILMFDRAYTERDEIRLSLFKFKLPRRPRPAWDWQYVIHRVERAARYGFRGRLIWKRFISPEDCLAEYTKWSSSLEAERGQGSRAK